MGNYLSHPIKEKETHDGAQEGGPCFGAAAMQGWRVRMEDAHVANLTLGDPAQRLSLFGVFDGHGGPEVAKFCAEHVTDVLQGTEAFKRGEWEGALAHSFLALDRHVAGEEGQRVLGQLARAEREKAREQVRGREPEVTIEDVAEQTGLSQASIRQYVLAAWRRRLGAGPAGAASGQGDVAGGSSGSSGSGSSGGSGEEGEEREGMWRAPAAAASRRRGATSRASRADEPVAVAAGVERRREEQGSSGVGRGEEEEGAGNDDEEEETTAAATTSDVSSESTSSADSQVSPPSASARRRVEEEEEGDVVVEGQLLLVVQEEEEDGDASGSGSSSSSGSGNSSDEESAEEEEALRSIDFRRMKDHLVRARPGYDSGSTAVVALLLGREALVVANAGDSRCVLSRGGKALDLSQDHKPDNPLELARIRAAGGSVAEGRVEGNLNLSRAIGDLTYKDAALAQARQMITAQPEVCTLALEAADDFVVLACDGIWNVLSSQEVVDHVSAGIAQGRALSALCEELCDRCCDDEVTDESDGAGMDNMTILIVRLPSPEEGEPHVHHHRHHHHRRHRRRSHRHHGEAEEDEEDDDYSSDGERGAGKRAKTS